MNYLPNKNSRIIRVKKKTVFFPLTVFSLFIVGYFVYTILNNSVQQKINAQTSCPPGPARIVLLIDKSGSMKYNFQGREVRPNRLDIAKSRSIEFIDLMKANPSSPRNSQAGAVSFDSSAYLTSEITGELDLVKTRISKISSPSKATCMSCALKEAHTQFNRFRGQTNRKNYIIFVSDGGATVSIEDGYIGDDETTGDDTKPEKETKEWVQKVVRENQASVFTINLGTRNDDKLFLREVAQLGNGSYHEATNPDAIDNAFKEIFKVINTGSISGKKLERLTNGSLRNVSDWQVTLSGSATQDSKYTNSSGEYTFDNLCSGTYTLQEELRAHEGWEPEAPLGGTFTLTLSPGEDLTGINFINRKATSTPSPWIKGFGGDFLLNNYTSNILPKETEFTLVNSTYSLSPGIFFSNRTTTFGRGKVSPKGWFVRDTLDYNNLRLTYDYLLATVKQNGKTGEINNIKDLCANGSISSCTIPANRSGIYHHTTSEPLIIKNSIISDINTDILILSTGKVILDGTISVNAGNTLLISAKEEISVNALVGTSPAVPNADNTSIDGIFVTDKNFTVESGNDCPISDRMLIMSGNVITQKKFVNNRNLCAQNADFPSFSIWERYDMALNLPSFYFRQNEIWQEVTP